MPIRLPFRWADFAVAASIFIAGMLTLLPAIQRSRERMNQAGCVFNLQQLGNSLAQYASLHPFLPYPPSHRSDTHAGMFAVMLHDAGVLNDLSVLDCPCNGPCPHVTKELASFEQVDQIRRTDPERVSAHALLGLCLQRRLSPRVRVMPGPLEVAHSASDPRPRRPARPRRLRSRSAKATAPTTAAGVRTCSSATAASAGSTRDVSVPHDPDILSQQRPSAAARRSCPGLGPGSQQGPVPGAAE